jgi:hypothetical protein
VSEQRLPKSVFLQSFVVQQRSLALQGVEIVGGRDPAVAEGRGLRREEVSECVLILAGQVRSRLNEGFNLIRLVVKIVLSQIRVA